MKRTTRNLMILGAAALLMVPGLVLAKGHGGCGQGGFHGGQGMGEEGPEMGHRGPGMVFRGIRALDLTEEQETQLKALREEMKESHSEIQEQMKSLHQELRELWTVDDPERDAILAKWEEIDKIRDSLRGDMVDHRLEVLEILTPEQREELTEMKEKHEPRQRMGRRGRGRR